MKKITALLLFVFITLPLFFSCGRDPEPGNTVGSTCYDYSLPKIIGDGYDNILNHRGDKVIVHFFGTWCEDGEIAVLDRLEKEERRLTVIAIHTSHQIEDAAPFIEDNFKNSDIIFLSDSPSNKKEDKYYTMLGGVDTYPYTLILDRDGVITAKKTGSFTYSEMKELID